MFVNGARTRVSFTVINSSAALTVVSSATTRRDRRDDVRDDRRDRREDARDNRRHNRRENMRDNRDHAPISAT